MNTVLLHKQAFLESFYKHFSIFEYLLLGAILGATDTIKTAHLVLGEFNPQYTECCFEHVERVSPNTYFKCISAESLS